MLHTREEPISKFLNEVISGRHACCIDAATEAWVQILSSEKFQDFFTKLVMKSCEQHLQYDQEAIITFNEVFAPIVLQLIISSLSIGTVAGTFTIYQAAHEVLAFMKPGPKGTV